MLDYSSIRDVFKNTDKINSSYKVIAEWNMNKYISIKEYGIYKGFPGFNVENIYPPSASTNILSGQNYLLYDDGTASLDTSQEYFSDLSSVFKPNRPDPGIVLLQKFGSMTFAPSSFNTKVSLMSTASARYYPVSKNRNYDYFNSAKLMNADPPSEIEKQFAYGISDVSSGNIAHANPFVVFEEELPCNKITVKVQNHTCIPEVFYVDILTSTSSWQNIYSSSATTNMDFSDGILEIYYNNGSWTKTVSQVDDINQLTSLSPTQLKKIKGIRFRVQKLTKVKSRNDPDEFNSPGCLELIELSPRLELDLTSYTEAFNFSTSLGDSTSFGLPVGSIVSGTGNITLSNEENIFLISNTLSSLKMLNQDVKFSLYQKVYVQSLSSTYTIPLKVMYSNEWNVGQDYSVQINLEDGMKFLRETNAPDMLFSSNAAMSSIILMLLDNSGITGLEFKKSSDAKIHDKEDTRIKNFFCKKEQTVAEVLEQIAIATQCSMYYDAVGRLNVLTKERLSENASIVQSTGPSASVQQTDFWFVGNEDYSVQDPEYAYVATASYTANIASISEQKINPITDGEITYHSYGPKRTAMVQNLMSQKNKIYDQLRIDQIPLQSLAFSNYGYGTSILWQVAEDSSSVLAAANVTRDITNKRLKNLFTASYSSFDEDNLVRQLYVLTSSSAVFDSEEKRDEAKRSLIIYLDVNEGTLINPFEGIILVDNEYIKYRGKLYYIASDNPVFSGYRIMFSPDEFRQTQLNLKSGDSLIFKGLVVEVKTKIIDKNDNEYWYEVINDGRGHFKSSVTEHFALAEDSDGMEEENRFKLMLGGTKLESKNMPGTVTANTKFNFLDKVKFKSARKNLGTLPPESLNSYLGFLQLSGPTSPMNETDILLSILDPNKNKNVVSRLQDMNTQVDEAVPGNFDSYVYMFGERNVYGQKIPLGFTPNAISTRMRLYSPRKKVDKNREIMSTNSSIAGIGFGLNENNEGYFLEVESAGSGKWMVDETNKWESNLRFYKIELKAQKNGKYVYEPKLLLRGTVGAFTTFDTGPQVIKRGEVSLDPVFELDILIKKYKKSISYTIIYGGQEIGTVDEKLNDAINVDATNAFLFVRNDSQAIFEYVMAAARPYGVSKTHKEKNWFKNYKYFNRQIEKGIIPVGKTFLFKDKEKGIRFYFNDFARLAREVKEYNIRFSAPAYVSSLLDVSDINPEFFIKDYESTAFGAKLTVVNSSGSSITLAEENMLPLYIVGIAAEEVNTGQVSLKDIYDVNEEDKKRLTDREKNISIYGSQTFNLDSQYIQSITHAKSLMRWVSRYCGRPRMKLSLEVFANPLVELGDKVRVFDKSRGYNQSNKNFGPKTFVVSSISYNASSGGPSMTIDITEVGE